MCVCVFRDSVNLCLIGIYRTNEKLSLFTVSLHCDIGKCYIELVTGGESGFENSWICVCMYVFLCADEQQEEHQQSIFHSYFSIFLINEQ